jgi:hypothetical protein
MRDSVRREFLRKEVLRQFMSISDSAVFEIIDALEKRYGSDLTHLTMDAIDFWVIANNVLQNRANRDRDRTIRVLFDDKNGTVSFGTGTDVLDQDSPSVSGGPEIPAARNKRADGGA